jgi:uncharacterized protein YdhG (YjbR/CyaY superfamily)
MRIDGHNCPNRAKHMKPASVDAYIAAQPETTRPVLESVRAAIRRALPDAREIISYQIPAYRLPKGTAIFFAGWKKHWSLYPAGKNLVAAFREELAPYEVNDKGTIRFPLQGDVPEDLVERIAAFRRTELG